MAGPSELASAAVDGRIGVEQPATGGSRKRQRVRRLLRIQAKNASGCSSGSEWPEHCRRHEAAVSRPRGATEGRQDLVACNDAGQQIAATCVRELCRSKRRWNRDDAGVRDPEAARVEQRRGCAAIEVGRRERRNLQASAQDRGLCGTPIGLDHVAHRLRGASVHAPQRAADSVQQAAASRLQHVLRQVLRVQPRHERSERVDQRCGDMRGRHERPRLTAVRDRVP